VKYWTLIVSILLLMVCLWSCAVSGFHILQWKLAEFVSNDVDYLLLSDPKIVERAVIGLASASGSIVFGALFFRQMKRQ
jgi:hypothetical protein